MSSRKPLPSIPKKIRKAHPDSSSSLTSSKTTDHNYLVPYILSDSDDDPLSEHDSGNRDIEEHETPKQPEQSEPTNARPSLKGITFRKSPRELLLERRLAQLNQENTALRQQLKTVATHENQEKDEIISMLRSQNQRYDDHIQQQNKLVARIANTISTVFKEYQDTVENLSTLSEVGSANNSHFSNDSDSDF
ncbi:hypothetical protein F5Y02DRAFT_418981 [Annulohypoxylon stygium]|nr:hypothetical protein F5Y02DRAFT_418981 [Annulohypoxylon stygium]